MTPAEGRKFALTVGAAFLVLGAVVQWRGHVPVAVALAALGGSLVLAGLLVPGRLGAVYRAWMGLALLISKVTTPVFMGIVYFAVLSPIGLVMQLVGRNPLARRPVEGSFWVARPEGPKRRSNLERQF